MPADSSLFHIASKPLIFAFFLYEHVRRWENIKCFLNCVSIALKQRSFPLDSGERWGAGSPCCSAGSARQLRDPQPARFGSPCAGPSALGEDNADEPGPGARSPRRRPPDRGAPPAGSAPAAPAPPRRRLPRCPRS